MLITDPAHTSRDLQTWTDWERYDKAIGASATISAMQDHAIAVIRSFAADGSCVCSVSWGKDSVVAAHLTWLADPTIPIVWVPTIRADGTSYEAAGTYRVRAAFLATHPDIEYIERPAIASNPKRGEPGYEQHQIDPSRRSQDVLREQITERYISGLRAEESRMRRLSIAHRGLNTPRTSRPIAYWTAEHVFAYLSREALPVHPTYAMTYGGRMDRRWLRVHPLRSAPPPASTIYGRDMTGWEDHYYPHLVTHAGVLDHRAARGVA